MAETNDHRDIFYRQLIYPDANSLISWLPQSLEAIKDVATVVVDTNALLVPYGVGRASLQEIGAKYRSLVGQDRLVVPGQVVREFASNRSIKLQELHQQLSRKRQFSISRSAYPLLAGLDGYSAITSLEDQLENLIQSYREAIDVVLTQVRNWHWNDPVTILYRDLFSANVIQDPAFDPGELKEELSRRVSNAIPPGYKDARKDDGGIGDLIIWRTILELGKSRKKPLIFVSGDQKADWWLQSEGGPLYPRFELVDEYRRYSEGQTLHLVTFSAFLGLAGASPTIVEEVRKEEQEVSQRTHGDGQETQSGTPRHFTEREPSPAISPDMLRLVADWQRVLEISPEALRGIEERVAEIQKALEISPEALRGIEERFAEMQKALEISPEALRGIEERVAEIQKALEISPEALRGIEERFAEMQKALEISPEALRGIEERVAEMQKALEISPEALRGIAEMHRRSDHEHSDKGD